MQDFVLYMFLAKFHCFEGYFLCFWLILRDCFGFLVDISCIFLISRSSPQNLACTPFIPKKSTCENRLSGCTGPQMHEARAFQAHF